MKSLLLCAVVLFSLYEDGHGMNLEQSFNTAVKGIEIPWNDIAQKTRSVAQSTAHVVDVESVYGGGEVYDPKIVCQQALNGDCVAQYSLYRHIKNNDFVAYMLLCISAVFGNFTDSFEEARSLGVDLEGNESLDVLEHKIANLTGQNE